MMMPPTEHPLLRAFYARDTVVVARALLGQRLVRVLNGQLLSGLICETEAYGGADDPASHAYHRTPRSEIMFGPPGIAYVYIVYGMHHCLNAVTACDGRPGAVLVRGIFPAEGIERMCVHRPGVAHRHLADGPGKLCQALGIALALNGCDLTESPELWVAPGEQVDSSEVIASPRVGVRGDEETKARQWRFVWQRSERTTKSDRCRDMTVDALV
jgi:DNA-3-methyladenine glycosylase